ncbi:MAG: hypothetical protein BGO39_04315 [Chloroflexi bacterium 54-19]|nr:MAG: hypothetical protein BGO39_04315 [Chloroflexi bacterium 54-19]
MESLPLVLYTTLIEVFVGTFAVLILTDFRGELGRGFLSSVGLTALAVAFCARLSLSGIDFGRGQQLYPGIDLGWNGFQDTWLSITLILLVVYNVMVGLGTDKARRISGIAALLACCLTLFAVAMLYRGSYLGGFIAPFSFFLGSAAVGTVLTGMLLGHWYLVTPTLTVAPLARINRLFFYSLLGQAVLVIVNAGPWVSNSLAVSEKWAVFFWLRVLVGIVFPLVLSYATMQTCKLKAHMSSTGFLYVALGGVLAGEIVSRVILFQTYVPL